MIKNKATLIQSIQNNKAFSYLLFWGHHSKNQDAVDKSCLSQWFPSPFVVEGYAYATAEHYMMAQKAKLFNDNEIFEQILDARTPKEAKDLGRKVKNFDADIWDSKAFDIVVVGNFEKFSQNKLLQYFLLETSSKILVEASPVDKIWGIGLAQDNPKALKPLEWEGENYLGFALMVVRDNLIMT